MSKIGIYFGTDTGTTRLIAKKLAKKLADNVTAKPLNINRVTVEDFLSHDVLILGTPSYGEGQVPGQSTGVQAGSWEEFLPKLQGIDMAGKTVALYGLGNQEKYSERFASALRILYDVFSRAGATLIGDWSTEGYTFEHSEAVVDGRFVGLVVDNNSQGMLTETRLDAWLEAIKPQLLQGLPSDTAEAV